MILHVCFLEKFIPTFIELINERFDPQEHFFLVYGDRAKFPITDCPNVEYQPFFCAIRNNWLIGLKNVFRFFSLAVSSEKIILHGLLNDNLVKVLASSPKLLFKCYWVIWGADLYRHNFRKKNFFSNVHEFFRRVVIKRIGHFVTSIYGDYEFAKRWYGSHGYFHESFVYTSNLFEPINSSSAPIESGLVNIQIGNSADPSNRHFEVLSLLELFKNKNIKIYTPLSYGEKVSYGEKDYIQRVIAYGQEIFGEKFVAMTKFVKLEEYKQFLANIDIAIFNSDRQQAMGNIVSLLGLGKKVFIRKTVTTFDFFNKHGVKLGDLDNFEISLLAREDAQLNKVKIKELFSLENLLGSLDRLFK